MSEAVLGFLVGGAIGLVGALVVFVLLRYLDDREERWLAARRASDDTGAAQIGAWVIRLTVNALLWGAIGIGYFVAALYGTRWLGGNLGFDPKMPFVVASVGPVFGFLLTKARPNRKRSTAAG